MSDAKHVRGVRPPLPRVKQIKTNLSLSLLASPLEPEQEKRTEIQMAEQPKLRRSQRKRVITHKVSEQESRLDQSEKSKGSSSKTETRLKNLKKNRTKQQGESFFDRNQLYVAPHLRTRAQILPPAHFLPEKTSLKIERAVSGGGNETIDGNESEEEEAFNCYCGERDNSNMIQCDKCEGWYHFKCQNLSQKDVKNISPSEDYYCHFCRAKSKKQKSKITKAHAFHSSSSLRSLHKDKLTPSTFSRVSTQDPLDLLLHEMEKRDQEELSKPNSQSHSQKSPERHQLEQNLKQTKEKGVTREGSVSQEEEGSPKIVKVRRIGQIAERGRLDKIKQLSHRSYSLMVETGDNSHLQVSIDEGDRSILNNIGGYEVFDEFKKIYSQAVRPETKIVLQAPKCGLLRPRPIRPVNNQKVSYFEPPVEKKESPVSHSIVPIESQKPSLLHAAQTLEAPIVSMHQMIRQTVPVVSVPLIYQRVIIPPCQNIFISFQETSSSSSERSSQN